MIPRILVAAIALLATGNHSWAAASEAQLSDPHIIASKALRARPPGDWKLKGKLTVTSGEEDKESTLNITYRFDETTGLISRYEYLDTDGTKQGIEVVYPFSGRPQVLDYKTGAPLREPHKNLLNSSFTPDDLSLNFLGWKKLKFGGVEELKSRPCYHIIAYGTGENTPYSRVEAWVDQEYFALMRTVCYDAEGNVVKKFEIKSLTVMEGNYIPKRIELTEPIRHRKTVLEILEAKKVG